MLQSDVAEYQAKRVALINEDRAYRPDYANAAKRSATEIEADKVVRKIRTFEASSVWSAKHENIEHPFPGMEFLTGTRLSAI
jgi:adenosine deaminase CECR1